MAIRILIYLEKIIVFCLAARILLWALSRKRQGMVTRIRFFSHLELGIHIGLCAVVLLAVYGKSYALFLAALGCITAVLLWFFPNRIVWISADKVSIGTGIYSRSELISTRCGGLYDKIETKTNCFKIYLPIYEPQIMDDLNENRKGDM